MTSEVVLLDTNILLRLAEPAHPQAAAAATAVDTLRRNGDVPVVLSQNLYEFYVVATRPKAVNGLGMSPEDAVSRIARIESLAIHQDDTTEVFGKWLSLVESHAVRGKPAHDARLAAAALVHGVDAVLTFNAGDFARYGLAVRTP